MANNAQVIKSLTSEQQQKMEEFRDYMKSLDFFEENMLKSNNFILRYLQAGNFNFEKSKVFVDNYLDLNKVYNRKEILQETFPADFAKKFCTYVGGKDNHNRPIAMIPHGGAWNVKEAIQQGREEMFVHYVIKVALTVEKLVIERDSDYCILVCDVSNVAYGNYIHKRTIEVLLEMINMVEKIAPGSIKKVYFVNAPKIWVAFFNSLRKLITIRADIYAFDSNREKWTKSLREYIPEDGICPEFGGSCTDYALI